MGGLKHHRTEGGQGGRRGHSNMDHWVTSGEIKAATRSGRRRDAKAAVARARDEEEARPGRARAGGGAADGFVELDHLGAAVEREKIGRTRAVHPYQWLWEPLEDDPTFVLRPMFGGRAAYVMGRLTLYFTAGKEPWRGMLVCTERAHHASLFAEFPELAPHSILPKWLYLPETANHFETTAERLVALARRHDPRLGIETPKRKRRSGRQRRG